MLVSEFVNLDKWFDESEEKYELIKNLQTLVTVLNHNIQARNRNNNNQPQQLQPFTEQKILVAKSMASFKKAYLTKAQLECLKVYMADDYIGESASDKFQEVFRDSTHDISFLHSYVKGILDPINRAKAEIKKAAESLHPFNKALSTDEYLNSQPRFSIIFTGHSTINTLSELKDASGEWNKIISSICIALDIPINEFKILGARNGSLIIDLSIAAAAMVPIGFILTLSMTLLERFAVSMRRIHDIVELDRGDERLTEIEEDVQKLTDKYFNLKKKIGSSDIAKKVISESNISPGKEHEAETHLKKAINKILTHLKNGGELDAYLPQARKGSNDNQTKASKLFEEFKRTLLEKEVDLPKLLRSFDFEEEIVGEKE